MCHHGQGITPPREPEKKNKGWCFITTAVCKYLNKSDDCYELTMLRAFRDGWLCHQPDGKALVGEYYRVAPLILEKLEQTDRREDMYKDIWSHYIAPCVKLIEENAYDACRTRYMDMVTNLKREFLTEGVQENVGKLIEA